MLQLIAIGSTEVYPGQTIETVNARDLWVFVESKQEFSPWIMNRIERYDFIEGVDWVFDKGIKNPLGGRPKGEYFISIEMAKSISMVEDNAKGKQIRRYFIECERLAKAKASVPTQADLVRSLKSDPQALRELLLANVERVITLESEVEEMTPKVKALDRIATHTVGSMCPSNAAKLLQISPTEMFNWLKANDYAFKRGRRWIAYQPRIKQGFLEQKVSIVQRKDANGQQIDNIYESLLVTAKGLVHIAKSMGKKLQDPGQKVLFSE